MSFSISCQQQAGRFSFFSPSLCSYQSLSFVADTCRSLHVGNQKYFFNTAWQIRPWDLSQWITILELQVGHGSWWSSHITSWTESLAEDFGLLSESLITSFHCSEVVDGRINWYQVHTLYLHAFYLLWDSVSLVCCKFKWQCAFLPLCTEYFCLRVSPKTLGAPVFYVPIALSKGRGRWYRVTRSLFSWNLLFILESQLTVILNYYLFLAIGHSKRQKSTGG